MQKAISRSSLPGHIFLIEDDDDLRSAIEAMLFFNGYKVSSFKNPANFINEVKIIRPAVLISDIRMPEMSGVELQSKLISEGNTIPIIFISGESTLEQGITALKQGAIEFLIKPFNQQDLLSAITAGIEKDTITIQRLLLRQQMESNLSMLSPREREVFELLGLGYSNIQIMKKLNISLPTAKQYKSGVMRKLNFKSLADLIRFRLEIS